MVAEGVGGSAAYRRYEPGWRVVYPDGDYDMAIEFGIDEDGELLALVDTERDFEEALEFDCPILAAPEMPRPRSRRLGGSLC